VLDEAKAPAIIGAFVVNRKPNENFLIIGLASYHTETGDSRPASFLSIRSTHRSQHGSSIVHSACLPPSQIEGTCRHAIRIQPELTCARLWKKKCGLKSRPPQQKFNEMETAHTDMLGVENNSHFAGLGLHDACDAAECISRTLSDTCLSNLICV